MIMKNSVHTSQKTHCTFITKINQLIGMLLRKTFAVYSHNHMKPINIFCGLNSELIAVKVDGNNCSLKD
jgi:hypothetical protein